MGKPIHEQFLEIAERLERKGTPAVRVIFSPNGYMKAMREQRDNFFPQDVPPTTYMGLPYTIRSDMAGDIGLHTEFEPRRDAVTVQLGFTAATGHVTVDGKPHGKPINILQIVGSSLTAAQLCDIIQAWLDSDDASHFDDFEKELQAVVERHGRFE